MPFPAQYCVQGPSDPSVYQENPSRAEDVSTLPPAVDATANNRVAIGGTVSVTCAAVDSTGDNLAATLRCTVLEKLFPVDPVELGGN